MNDTLQDANRIEKKEEVSGADHAHIADLKHLIEQLQMNYSFFSEMQDEEVTELLGVCNKISFEDGHRIFSEGDVADRFYLVLSGEIAITIGGVEVARIRAGQIFGEMALLEHIPRTATATVISRAMLFSLPAESISTMIPSLALKVVINIARQMSEKLRETNSHIHIS
jgi:CRP-like cAMP-binding protein